MAFLVTDEVSWANEIMKTQNRFTFLNKEKDNELKLKLKLSLYTVTVILFLFKLMPVLLCFIFYILVTKLVKKSTSSVAL